MIDVVFLLLVFFVWTSSFQRPEFDLPGAIAAPPGSTLLETSPEVPQTFDEIVIRIVSGGAEDRIELNGTRIADTAALTDRLTSIIQIGVQPPVIVDPDDTTTMELAVAVYDAARAAGVDRVLFAAKK